MIVLRRDGTGIPRPRRRTARFVAAGGLALIGACLWSTADIVGEANLELDLSHIPAEAREARISVTDASGGHFSREAQVSGEAMTVYVGHLALGRAVVHTELISSAGSPVGCREDAIQIGSHDKAHLELDLGAPSLETDAACNDGLDNDCDSVVDCEDPDCRGARRFCAVGGCLGEQHCQGPDWGGCTGVSPTPEKSYAACTDHSDNDCDGTVDCEDLDCHCTGCGC
jgi:hypothetical protein